MYWQRGTVSEEQALLIFRHLPVDVSFADENDVLRFWSGSSSYRTCDARYIGRDVRDCHPSESLDVLETILSEFKAGTKNVAEGWSTKADGTIKLVRYAAVRDGGGTYRGILEMIQVASDLQAISGEQRLPGW
jgi:DUF438 domain-containing protein